MCLFPNRSQPNKTQACLKKEGDARESKFGLKQMEVKRYGYGIVATGPVSGIELLSQSISCLRYMAVICN